MRAEAQLMPATNGKPQGAGLSISVTKDWLYRMGAASSTDSSVSSRPVPASVCNRTPRAVWTAARCVCRAAISARSAAAASRDTFGGPMDVSQQVVQPYDGCRSVSEGRKGHARITLVRGLCGRS